jgi:hypothetical protein
VFAYLTITISYEATVKNVVVKKEPIFTIGKIIPNKKIYEEDQISILKTVKR